MTELFGSTRNVVKERYALLTPSGFVNGPLPGWTNTICNVLISPHLGARFSQVLFTLQKGGQFRGSTGPNQHFYYGLDGEVRIKAQGKTHQIKSGCYLYIPASENLEIVTEKPGARLMVFQKPYQNLLGQNPPGVLAGHESKVKGQPFLGNEDARLQVLLPDEPAFDMAVNVFTYQPGATLPFVETHVMEHGLLMLAGQGVYRLDADWHPVQAGDVIWMASYCPQWFVAMGKTPASYIYYKDVNRNPQPFAAQQA
jgi:(S)-ureidoglycine aminohydrolase